MARPVSRARVIVSDAAVNSSSASARAERASVIVERIERVGTAAKSEDSQELLNAIKAIQSDLFKVQANLRDTQLQLSDADQRTLELDAQLAHQTDELNRINSERINALAASEQAKADSTLAKRQLAESKRALLWERIKKWGISGGIVGLFAAGWIFKLIGAGARFA